MGFRLGERLVLCGLVKHAHFNGAVGTVVHPEREPELRVPGTVKVRLDSGAEVAAKPENVVRADPGASPSGASPAAPADPLKPVSGWSGMIGAPAGKPPMVDEAAQKAALDALEIALNVAQRTAEEEVRRQAVKGSPG